MGASSLGLLQVSRLLNDAYYTKSNNIEAVVLLLLF